MAARQTKPGKLTPFTLGYGQTADDAIADSDPKGQKVQ